MYFKVAVLLCLCFSNFWNTPQINLDWQSYLSSVNSRPILMWFWDRPQKSSLEIEYEIKNKYLNDREKEINKKGKKLDELNRKAGEADAYKKFFNFSIIIIFVLIGIIVLLVKKNYEFLSAPFIKGSSLSEERQNSDKANQLISWLSENVSPKQILESFSNKDESKKLPQGDDVKESKEIEKS